MLITEICVFNVATVNTKKKVYNLSKFVAFQMFAEFSRGDLVWFDPGIGYVLPGEVLEYHRTAQVQNTVYKNKGTVQPD
jgi:hypothetical protein